MREYFPGQEKYVIVVQTMLMNTTIDSMLQFLQNDTEFMSSVTRWERIPAKEGMFEPFPPDLAPCLSKALLERGLENLYSHQAECYREIRKGNNVVVVTPTASGKTMCFNLPILQTLIERKEARALYLFPTKALSQDQQSALNDVLLGGELPVKVCTYDGDTPASLRITARDSGRIIISNPDMLHAGILPNHPKWIKFFQNLAFIVIDEVHAYRGVFGSHLTNLIRRLKRVAEFYKSRPLFICCSATIGNPLELAERLIERKAVMISKNGAPQGEKHVILYNPPLVDRVQGIRRGVVNESQRIALKFLKHGIKTIVFSRSRVQTELIASYINKSLENFYTNNDRIRVEAYRGGYLPSERRQIEKGLRDGTIQGVVSTNALELGIDIGGLDAAILAGYPGSITSTLQRIGRAGRRNSLSLGILIASSSPLDQYMITHPEYFFSQSPESACIDPDNLYILMDHLKCASFELPFKKNEGFPGSVDELLGFLEENGVLRFAEHAYYWADQSYPAEQVSLRSSSSENVIIIDTTKGRNSVIGEMDKPSAKELIFEGAVYLHRGEQYMVLKLDIENGKCYVEESTAGFYTDAIVKKDIKVLKEDEFSHTLGTEFVLADVLVRSQVTKYKKLKFHTNENIGYGDVFLPEEEMHTRSVILVFRPGTDALAAFETLPEQLKGAVMAGLGFLVKQVAPVFLLCETNDIGVAERLKDPHFEVPALFVYDSYPGGVGLSEGFLKHASEILRAAREVVKNCPCTEGCPSCIGALDLRGVEGNPKEGVAAFLRLWLEANNE